MKVISNEQLINQGNLEITNKIGCSNMCEYCPQEKLIYEYQKNEKKVKR